MILRGRWVVTMAGPPIANGAIAVEGERIVDVGPWKQVAAHHTGEVIDLGESALMPGLINVHCHLDYTGLRGTVPPSESFTTWIRTINQRKADWSPQDFLGSIETGFAEAASFGTTSIVNLEAFPELIGKVKDIPLRTWWIAEMIDVREPVSPARLLQNHGALRGFAPHAPFTASATLYRESAALGAERDLVLSTHLAESNEEMRMFAQGEGPLFKFLNGIGRPMGDCGHRTPLGHLLEMGVLDERWIVAHLNELIEADFVALEHAPRFHIAHCPRSHAYFGHSPFAFHGLKALRFNICIATDSLASNHDLSLLAELRQFRNIEPALSAQDLLELVTVNPASALRQDQTLGRLRPGFLADLIAVPSTAEGQGLYDEIIAWDETVPWMMIGGRRVENT